MLGLYPFADVLYAKKENTLTFAIRPSGAMKLKNCWAEDMVPQN